MKPHFPSSLFLPFSHRRFGSVTSHTSLHPNPWRPVEGEKDLFQSVLWKKVRVLKIWPYFQGRNRDPAVGMCRHGEEVGRWVNWGIRIDKLVLEKTFESPLDSKEIKPVDPKGNQLWIYIGRTDAEAEAPIIWPPDAKNSQEKTLMLGKTEDRRRKGWQRMRWLEDITKSMDMSLSKLQGIVKDREASWVAQSVVLQSRTRLSNWMTTNTHHHVCNRQLVRSCCLARRAQPGALWCPRGRVLEGPGRRGYMYTQLIYFTVQRKLTQHCKATIPQFKNIWIYYVHVIYLLYEFIVSH